MKQADGKSRKEWRRRYLGPNTSNQKVWMRFDVFGAIRWPMTGLHTINHTYRQTKNVRSLTLSSRDQRDRTAQPEIRLICSIAYRRMSLCPSVRLFVCLSVCLSVSVRRTRNKINHAAWTTLTIGNYWTNVTTRTDGSPLKTGHWFAAAECGPHRL